MSERQDTKVRELLGDPVDLELFDRGTVVGERYEPLLENMGTFADEVAERVKRFSDEYGPKAQRLNEEPAFLLGVMSSVSQRREGMEVREVTA